VEFHMLAHNAFLARKRRVFLFFWEFESHCNL
jgi:hypothetical protein